MADTNLFDFSAALRLQKLKYEFDAMADAVIRANELAIGNIPQCKLVQQFLATHGLPWQAFYLPLALSHEQLHELSGCLQVLHDAMETERTRLRMCYKVSNENELPHERRVLFDAALRAFIEREDHYP